MSDVIVALATPPGRGAIGILRLSGPGCLRIVLSWTKYARELGPLGTRSDPQTPGTGTPKGRRPRLPESVGLGRPEPADLRSSGREAELCPPRLATLLWLYDGDERLDRALVTLFEPGSSYTGEEMVEVSAHGSPYILERLLALAVAGGARQAQPGEFTQRAFLAGRLDLSQAEAVCDLIQARTRLAHRAAVAQLEGGLSRRAASLRRSILELRTLAEAALDHPDEDLLPEGLSPAAVDAVLAEARTLLQGARRGRLARCGARVALVGPRNAGKSSLLNALLGRDRAIVHEEPGTTRDTIEENCQIHGLEVALIDTAGLSDGPVGPVESIGQQRSLAAARGADLVLLVLDRTVEPARQGPALAWARAQCEAGGQPLVAALNKSDLGPARTRPEDLGGTRALEVSALRGHGVDELARAAAASLLREGAPTGAGEPLAVSARHLGALEACAARLLGARERLAAHDHVLAAEDLRRAADALDSVEGRTAPEDVLAAVFSRFCVGK